MRNSKGNSFEERGKPVLVKVPQAPQTKKNRESGNASFDEAGSIAAYGIGSGLLYTRKLQSSVR